MPTCEPHLRHPLRVAHRARPRADHLRRRRPPALDDDERVEELALPVLPAARLVPGERRERGNDRTRVVPMDDRVAVGRLDAPEAEHDRGRDAVVAARCARGAPRAPAASPCRSTMRHSETRRFRYCQSCSLNSGWLRSSSKTLMSGSSPRVTRVVGRSETPRASAAGAKRLAPTARRGARVRTCGRACGDDQSENGNQGGQAKVYATTRRRERWAAGDEGTRRAWGPAACQS